MKMTEEIQWFTTKKKPKLRGWYLVKTSSRDQSIRLESYGGYPEPSWTSMYDRVIYWANLPTGPRRDKDEI